MADGDGERRLGGSARRSRRARDRDQFAAVRARESRLRACGGSVAGRGRQAELLSQSERERSSPPGRRDLPIEAAIGRREARIGRLGRER